jgi:tetratricopeptide (TPR) repeat protein
LRGKLDAAQSALNQSLVIDPTFLPAKKYQIYILLTQDRIDQALTMVNEILAHHAEDIDSLYLKGRILFQQRDMKGAIAVLKQVDVRQPTYNFGPYGYDLGYYLGIAYANNGQFAEAREQWRRMLSQYPDQHSIRLLVAEASLRLGDLHIAMTETQKILEAEPRNIQAVLLQGQVAMYSGRLHEAVAAFKMALTSAPNNPQAYYGLGVAYENQHNFQDAITAFEAVLRLDEDAIDALAHLTALYHDTGRPQKALARCATQIQRSPNNAALHQLMGTLFLRQNQNHEAEASLVKAISLDPQRPQPYFYLGILYEKEGDYAQATKYYEQVLTLAPTFAQAANNLAWLYAEHWGNLSRAQTLAETANKYLPQDANVLDTLGWIYYKQNSLHRAILLLEEGTQKKPTNPTIHYHLGMAYYKNGEREAAHRALSQSLKLNPTHTNAEIARQHLAALRQKAEQR